VDGDEAQTSAAPATSAPGNKSPARQFELGDLATNRILFALTLLGVLLPVNAIVNRYHHVDFIYFYPHSHWFKGPYQAHSISVLYFMEGLLAAAVYLYGFDFIFKFKIFERAGTVLYALALLMPLIYFYFYILQHISDAISGLNSALYWIILFALGIPLWAIAAVIRVISRRLQD
jgi:hypothetical protein